MWFMVGLVLLVLVLGIYHVVSGDDGIKRDSGVQTGYMSDKEYLDNGGKIVYRHYGRNRE